MQARRVVCRFSGCNLWSGIRDVGSRRPILPVLDTDRRDRTERLAERYAAEERTRRLYHGSPMASCETRNRTRSCRGEPLLQIDAPMSHA